MLKFKPKDGQIDYTKARWAPVINCVVKYKKTWIVHPILVIVKDNKINLDWEAINYKWIKPKGAKKLKLLPGFKKVLQKLSKYV